MGTPIEIISDACEIIDAALFSGDSFFRKEPREMLAEYIDSWRRRIGQIEELELGEGLE